MRKRRLVTAGVLVLAAATLFIVGCLLGTSFGGGAFSALAGILLGFAAHLVLG